MALDFKHAWGDLSDLMEDFLYADLPYQFDRYLIAIGQRNLLHLLRPFISKMGAEEWMYVNIGRMSSDSKFGLLHPEHKLYYIDKDLFVKAAIQSRNPYWVNLVELFQNHNANLILHTGGHAFNKFFRRYTVLDFIGQFSPRTVYPFIIHSGYNDIVKYLILFESARAMNLPAIDFLLFPTAGMKKYKIELDKDIVVTVDRFYRDSVPRLLNSPLLDVNRAIDDTIRIAEEKGIYTICKALCPDKLERLLSNRDFVGLCIANCISADEIGNIRELVKHPYNTRYLRHAINQFTSPAVIKMLDFGTTDTKDYRVNFYKHHIIAEGATLSDFCDSDLPYLIENIEHIDCSSSFKMEVINWLTCPPIHPLHKRNEYKRAIKRISATIEYAD